MERQICSILYKQLLATTRFVCLSAFLITVFSLVLRPDFWYTCTYLGAVLGNAHLTIFLSPRLGLLFFLVPGLTYSAAILLHRDIFEPFCMSNRHNDMRCLFECFLDHSCFSYTLCSSIMQCTHVETYLPFLYEKLMQCLSQHALSVWVPFNHGCSLVLRLDIHVHICVLCSSMM